MTEWLPSPEVASFPDLTEDYLRMVGRDTSLGRIYSSSGQYSLTWRDFRWFGPTQSRFDHQRPPAHHSADRGVMYVAPAIRNLRGQISPALKTCLAECFRDRGVVETAPGAPYFAIFRPTRELRLLDLADTDWVTRAGGNAAISSGLRETSRQWAMGIYARYPEVDGVIFSSSNVPSARSIALWERADDALPTRADFNEPLSYLGLRAALEKYANELNLGLAF